VRGGPREPATPGLGSDALTGGWSVE
jgi:hypothetical protein